MNNHFLLIALRHSSKHPVQSLLMIVGIALGVAMIVAIDVANGSARQAFALSTDTITGKASHQLVGSSGQLPTSLYLTLRRDLGLREVAPVVTELVLLPQYNDLPMQFLGVDPFAEPPFRSYLGGDGISLDGVTQLLVQPNSILVDQTVATRYGWQLGDTISLLAKGQLKTVTLVGVLQAGDEFSQRALSGLLISDISTAQEIFEQTDTLSYIDLILPDDDPALEAKISQMLPPNVQLQRSTLRNQTVNQMTAAFELNLSALSFLALIVGMFLIYNTISFSVVQRRPVLGTLRCLGVTRREIFALVLSEALVLSSVGALLGVGLGIVLGRGLVGLVTQTINDMFFTLTVQTVSLNPFTLYKGFIAGITAGVIAAFIPALEATTVPPTSTLKRSIGEDRLQQLIPFLSVAGVGLMGVGGLILWGITRYLWVSFFGITLVLLGAAALTPMVTRGMILLLMPLTTKFGGIIGVMAPRDILRSLSRTSVTIAALMLAVTVIIGVSVMVDSFRNTVVVWLDDILAADIYITPVGQGQRVRGRIDPTFINHMEALPQVEAVGLLQRAQSTSLDYGLVELRASSAQPAETKRPFLWTEGSVEAAFAAMDGGAVTVSEVFARRHQLPLSAPSTITLNTPDGPQSFRVVGVFYDYSMPEVGYVAMRLSTYQQYWLDMEVSNVGLYLQTVSLAEVDTLTEALRKQYGGAYLLEFSSNRGIKQGALEVFDRTFTITAALRLLATVVAFIGVLSALMALQLERTRELGTLRASGMSLRQLWAKTLLETGLMGLIAGLFAMPIGMLLAVILISVINLRSFGWTLQLYLTPSIFGMALVVALTAALLAAIYPVLRLSRMEIALALREE